LFVYAPVTGEPVARVLAAQQLTQWLWDISVFILSYLSGRAFGSKPVKRAESRAHIAVRSPDRLEFVPIADLIAISGQGNYAALHTPSRDVLHRATLSDMQARLEPYGFIRIHRSHLIRPERIHSIRKKGGRVSEVTLEGGSRYPVSESQAPALASWMDAALDAD